jgi:hypothetical protein
VGVAKGFPHRKRIDLASDRADDSKGDDEKFCMEEVINMRLNQQGKEEFLVKWVGYPLSHATWKPADHHSSEEACKYYLLF